MINAIVGIGLGVIIMFILWVGSVVMDKMYERKLDKIHKRKYGVERRSSYGSAAGGSSSGDSASAAAVTAAISSSM